MTLPKFAEMWLFVGIVCCGIASGATSARAATFGSNLSAGANDSVCKFQSLEPETRVCTVGQLDLVSGHTSTGGVVAPFDGVIVRWSVIGGTPLPGTGTVKLALRSMPSGFLERGPEVELPLGSPGTRYTFPERMPVGVGQHIGLRVSVANRSTREAGAPIAFQEDGVGIVNQWAGEQYESIWEGHEENVELLMEAEIEPDGDGDGYGDLTQDCSPNKVGSDQRCDLHAPAIRFRYAEHQPFLKTGAILVHASLHESGFASAVGRMFVMGKQRRWVSGLRGAGSRPVGAGGWTTLRLQLRKRPLMAARTAVRKGKRILIMVGVIAVDEKGNERREMVELRSR